MSTAHPIGSVHCARCAKPFVMADGQDDCCCDSGTYEDGSHDEGYCRDCCGGHHGAHYPYPTYQRTDCDQ